ncbi:MAG TPA: AraC family transcriptional regulator ligand-binding domain-containing protein [Steroidobacteraceae bacterium]|jgi:AraC-like DNA-binding protein
MDNQLAFLDTGGIVPRNPRELIYARATFTVATAARKLGIDVDLTTLAPSLERGEPLIPVAEHTAVIRAIYADERETLGIDLAQALPLERAGLWSSLLRSSNTFGELLRRASRYMRVVNRYSEFFLEERANRVAMVCPHADPSPYGRREQVVCTFLGHWIAWGRELTQTSFAVDARFRWSEVRDPAPFQRFFGGQVEFGADEDVVLLSPDVAALRLIEPTPEFVEQFESYAAALIRRMQPPASFLERVREAIAEGLLTGGASEGAVARSFAMTVRTMHRHLVGAGSSFREIRDELLLHRAQELLRESRAPIGEVSYLLGYAEPSTFHRAFRRWTGLTPSQWRKRL